MGVLEIYNQRMASFYAAGNNGAAIAVRKEYGTLTTQEKQDYITGVKLLKAKSIPQDPNNPNGPTNMYDAFVALHIDAMKTYSDGSTSAAHAGPAFLPWHRRFLFEFELNLADVLNKPDYALPYFDWAKTALANSDNAQANLTNYGIWSADFLGGSGNPVSTGPFRQGDWRTYVKFNSTRSLARGYGTRQFVFNDGNSTLSDFQICAMGLAMREQTSIYEDFRYPLESFVHNPFHNWIGGQMGTAFSPEDPLFFLHHCFLDKIWAQWDWHNFLISGANYPRRSRFPVGHNAVDTLHRTEQLEWKGVNNLPGMAPISDPISKVDDWIDYESRGYRYDEVWYWRDKYVKLHFSPTTDNSYVQVQADGSLKANATVNAATQFLILPGSIWLDNRGSKFVYSSPSASVRLVYKDDDGLSFFLTDKFGSSDSAVKSISSLAIDSTRDPNAHMIMILPTNFELRSPPSGDPHNYDGLTFSRYLNQPREQVIYCDANSNLRVGPLDGNETRCTFVLEPQKG